MRFHLSTQPLSILALALATVTAAARPVNAALIDFEPIPSLTLVRDQFLSLGLRVTGAGPLSGLVFSEGMFGVGNYGNSPTQVMHIGERGEPTTLYFVSPVDPDTVVGAMSFSLLMGDGHPDSETFPVTYFDVSGGILQGPTQFTTVENGLRLTATSLTLGGLIGSVELRLLPASASGVSSDDLEFTAVPEPSMLPILVLSGALFFFLWRRRGARPEQLR